MSDPLQPPRLFGSPETPAALRAALEGARNAGPSARQIEQLVEGVETRLAGPAHLDPALHAEPGAGLPSAGLRPWSRWVLPGAGIGAAVLAGLLLSRWDAARQPIVDDAEPTVPPAASAHALPGSGGDSTLRAAPVPPLEGSALPESMEARPAPAPLKVPHAASGAVPGAASASPAPDAPPGTVAQNAPADGLDEFQLLRRARAALAGDPGGALRLAEEHAQRFGRGMLAQEREAIAVEALARLGRTAEARTRAQRLLRQYPDSPYRTRLETLTASRRAGEGPR